MDIKFSDSDITPHEQPQRSDVFTLESDSMKAYVTTTGAVFGLLTLAHLWRVIYEEPHLATDPWYVPITVASGALCLWAWRLLRLSTRS